MSKEAILTKYAGALAARLQFVGEQIRDVQRSLVETPYPPASTKGEPPHLRTGQLKAHIVVSEVEQRGLMLSVTNSVQDPPLIYGKWLEYGTNRMSPRPFFFLGVELVKPFIGEMLVGRKP